MVNRKDVTKLLTSAAREYFLGKRYAVYLEVGVSMYGQHRADVLALGYRGEIVIVEVKSCLADFTGDKKWCKYLEYCNKMYFIILEEEHNRFKKFYSSFKEVGVGVILYNPISGKTKVKVNAKKSNTRKGIKKRLITELAYKAMRRK